MSVYDPMIYTASEEQSHQFYQMPKELFTNERYKTLSSNAKLLYTALLDRKQLSKKNGWLDEFGQVFLIYTRENIAGLLNISVRTAGKVFKELRDVDLIVEEQQGLNKPNKIYVKKLVYSNDVKGQEEDSGQETNDVPTSYTESSKTEIINNIKGEPLKYYSIYNINDLNKVTNDKIALVVLTYAANYRQTRGVNHPNLKAEQLINVTNTLERIDLHHSLSDEDWNNLVDRYFETTTSDCNINHFAYGNELEGTIRGMLDTLN